MAMNRRCQRKTGNGRQTRASLDGLWRSASTNCATACPM